VGYGGPSNPTTPNIHVRVGPFPALPPAVFAVAAGHRHRRHECCDLLVWCCMFERRSFVLPLLFPLCLSYKAELTVVVGDSRYGGPTTMWRPLP
jgi:hypothetical protein